MIKTFNWKNIYLYLVIFTLVYSCKNQKLNDRVTIKYSSIHNDSIVIYVENNLKTIIIASPTNNEAHLKSITYLSSGQELSIWNLVRKAIIDSSLKESKERSTDAMIIDILIDGRNYQYGIHQIKSSPVLSQLVEEITKANTSEKTTYNLWENMENIKK